MVPTALIHCPLQIPLCDTLPAEVERPSPRTSSLRRDPGTDPARPGELVGCWELDIPNLNFGQINLTAPSRQPWLLDPAHR